MPEPKSTAKGVLGGLAGIVGLSVVAGMLVTATVTPAIAVSSAAASSAITMFNGLPSYLEIGELMQPSTMYYTNPEGEHVEMATFFDQDREPMAFDQVAPVMYDAIISSEDPRFYDHGGIDIIGTARAVIKTYTGGAVQGGSSISQQYVKNVQVQACNADAENDEELAACYDDAVTSDGTTGMARKVREMKYAIELEKQYNKDDILLGYLNIAGFGGLTYGIQAAAQRYFSVNAADLNLSQAAALAGIVQNPNAYRLDLPDREVNGAADGYSATKTRQKYVLGQMLREGKITQEQYQEAYDAPIEPLISDPQVGCGSVGAGAGYFCDYVTWTIKNDPAFGETQDDRDRLLRRGGLKIYTTLDMRVQAPSEEAMERYVPASVDYMSLGAAGVSLEVSTGRILAMVQNTNFAQSQALLEQDSSYSAVNFNTTKAYGGSIGFPMGSTYKLFTLLDWLEQGHSVNEVLNGRMRLFPKFNAKCAGGVYTNKDLMNNFGKAGGKVGTVMDFTATSLNTGFLAMAAELDLCDINEMAKRLGVTYGDGSDITKDKFNDAGEQIEAANAPYASVLGSKNVSPMAMAGAYATVANGGKYCQPKAIDSITGPNGESIEPPKTTCEQVISPEVASTAAFALQRVMSSGTGTPSNTWDGTPLIGKTGTDDSFHTAMVESSSKVATAVWVGNYRDRVSLWNNWVSGVRLSDLRHKLAPAMQRAANAAYPGERFPQPDKNLTRNVMKDLPDVIGKTIEDATDILEKAGFSVAVGDPVDSTAPAGTVGAQTPGAGKVAGGTTVTINPSTGEGAGIPAVNGMTPAAAIDAIKAAGFNKVSLGQCTESPNAPAAGAATDTDPPAGTMANRNAKVSVNYTANDC